MVGAAGRAASTKPHQPPLETIPVAVYVSLPMWELNRFSPMQFIPIYSEQASKRFASLSLDIFIFLGIKIKEQYMLRQ